MQHYRSAVRERRGQFQYRKRYSPVQHISRKEWVLDEVSIPQAVFACATMNIALVVSAGAVSIPQAVFACATPHVDCMPRGEPVSIPQAVFACATAFTPHSEMKYLVSIPQAVFACATPREIPIQPMNHGFQYRKRYSPVQRHLEPCLGCFKRFQYRKRYSPVQR